MPTSHKNEDPSKHQNGMDHASSPHQDEKEEEQVAPLVASWRKFSRFEEYSWGSTTSVSAFLGEWEDRLASAMEAGCLYSDMVLAFKGQ